MARAKRSRGPLMLLLLIVVAGAIAIARKERLLGGLGSWGTRQDAPGPGTPGGPGAPSDGTDAGDGTADPDPETLVPTPEVLRARGYGEETPEHVIAGVVLDVPGATPFTTGEVGLVRHYLEPEDRIDLPFGQELAARAPLGEDGRFYFGLLEPGRYEVQLRIEGEEPRALAVEQWLTIQRREAQVFVLGSLEVTGRVYGRDGQPAPGVRVRITREATGGGSGPVVADVITDEAGYCRATRLLAGDCWLTAYLAPDSKDPADRPSVHAPLTDKGTNTRNVGWPGPRRAVSGVVRFADGSPVPGPGLVRIALPSGDGGIIEQSVDADGRFEVLVPMGDWSIQAHMPGHLGRVYPTATFAFEAHDLQVKDAHVQDVVAPNARVEVRLLAPEAGRAYLVQVRPPDSRWTRTIQALDPSRVVITGLEPGDWLLAVLDPESHQRTEEVSVTVTGAKDEILRLELPVPGPSSESEEK